MKRGFTLLELIVVIIIIGILATLGFTQYTKVVEKGRIAEAKMILGQMKTAQEAYKLEFGGYTSTIEQLGVNVATDCPATGPTALYYFRYKIDAAATTTFTLRATRCPVGSGKNPGSAVTYAITLDQNGTWGGDTPGYN